jgi:hypothetical protein
VEKLASEDDASPCAVAAGEATLPPNKAGFAVVFTPWAHQGANRAQYLGAYNLKATQERFPS